MEEDAVSNINFISCVYFVKQGVSKEKPDKIKLTQEELARIITETKSSLEGRDEGDDEDDEDDNEMEVNVESGGNPATGDEFKFDNYDEEDNSPMVRIGDIAVIDPNENLEDDENDSEAEDDKIKPTDNLILVGHVEDDSVCMEVYIWSEDDGSLYVHHDFLLPSYPLCIEWLNHDPSNSEPGNLCAIGSMDPIITVWDLDIQDSLEPAFKLGSKGNRKKNHPKYGHRDAVLDISWNQHFPHILASGSVDKTVILWDLDEGKPNTTITSFDEKVQAVKFHPTEAQSLLTGSCDGLVKLYDCRDLANIGSNFKSWNLGSEIEKVVWDMKNTNFFMASTNDGQIYYIDCRQTVPLWCKNAHDEEVTGITLPPTVPGMMITTSADGNLRIWDYNDRGATMIYDEEMKIGRIHSMGYSPESPFIVGIGGDNKKRQFRVINAFNYDSVKHTFGNRIASVSTME